MYKLRRSTYSKTVKSACQAYARVVEDVPRSTRYKLRTSTRKQTLKLLKEAQIYNLHLRVRMYAWSSSPRLITDRSKYYYYTDLKKQKPHQLMRTIIITRKRKCPTNRRDFGSLKRVVNIPIEIPLLSFPVFVGFDADCIHVQNFVADQHERFINYMLHMFG